MEQVLSQLSGATRQRVKDRAFLYDGARERLVGELSIPVRGLLGPVKWGRNHEVCDHGMGVGWKAGMS